MRKDARDDAATMDEYRLTPPVIRQMLADPDFYEECPSFSFLAKYGLATTAAWLRCLTSRSTPDYPGREEEKHLEARLAGLLAIFSSHVYNMYEADGSALEDVRRYLEACEGRSLGPIRLDYLHNGETRVIEF